MRVLWQSVFLSSGFLKSRTWFVVLLFSVISYATNLLMFSMAAWQVRCMKHWVVHHTAQRTEFMRNSCYSGWRKLELSSTFCNRWNDLFCKRSVRRALCYTARCFIDLSRRLREDCGASCVTDYAVYQDLVMDTSVYLVRYDGLLVKTRTHKTVSLSLYLRF